MSLLHGAITALITPFTSDGKAVDFEGLSQLLERQIAAGISGVLPLGTTGETPTLTPAEKEAVLQHTVSVVAGRVPVMVGCGSNCTKTTVESTKRAADLGADSVLIVSPYYNRPSQEGLYAHFAAVCQAVSVPVVIYNIASRTGVNIETPTLIRICEHENVVGVKEASGNLKQIADVIRAIQMERDTFSVLSGDDGMTLPLMALGGRGVISVASNLVPEEVCALANAAASEDLSTARTIHHSLAPLFDALFLETNPVPLKAALSLCSLPAGPVRLPLVTLQEPSLARLRATLTEFGLLEQ